VSGTLLVDAAAQAAFVALSGDANPLHTDPLVARRLPFGRVAVHGMHLALLALEHVAADGTTPCRVRATFRHPVGVGDPVDLTVDVGTCRLTVGGRAVADVRVDGDGRAPTGRALPPLTALHTPVDLRFDDLDGLAGTIAVGGDAAAIAARFPHLPVVVAAELLTITRLVGMHVPGLHSMLSSFDLTVAASAGDADELAYRVASADDRFSKVVLRVDGPTVHGTVTAFVRPVPTDQRVDTTIVEPGEFEGVRALVVGGSRGLGAAAVQLLAAGGADVRFTYHRGADDAATVAAASPGSSAHQLDVAAPHDIDAITADGWQPTLLAWCASPPIFVGAREVYSPALQQQFRAVYVDAFLRTVERLGPDRLTAILWPSSDAVTTGVPGLAEYADAKRAGEQACGEVAAAHPHITVQAPRFPRLRTDQTASFVPVDAADPAPHVLAALRACSGRQPGRHLH
jgi:acyl dehydratase/NAD(P)-dependent dehydrogenase (short-subunit alcohol dehydrogenase family)